MMPSIVNVAGNCAITHFLFQGSGLNELMCLALKCSVETCAQHLPEDDVAKKTILEVVSGLSLAYSPLSSVVQTLQQGLITQVGWVALFGGLRSYGGIVSRKIYEAYKATMGEDSRQSAPWVEVGTNLALRILTPVSTVSPGAVTYHFAGFEENRTLVTGTSTVKTKGHCKIEASSGLQRFTLDTCATEDRFSIESAEKNTLTLLYMKADRSEPTPVTLSWDGENHIEVLSSDRVLQDSISSAIVQTHSSSYPVGKDTIFSDPKHEFWVKINDVQQHHFDRNFPTWKAIHKSTLSPSDRTKTMLKAIQKNNPDDYKKLVADSKLMATVNEIGKNPLLWKLLIQEGISSVVLGARGIGTVGLNTDATPPEMQVFLSVYIKAFTDISLVGPRETLTNLCLTTAIREKYYPEDSTESTVKELIGVGNDDWLSNETRDRNRFLGLAFGLPPSWIAGYEDIHDMIQELNYAFPNLPAQLLNFVTRAFNKQQGPKITIDIDDLIKEARGLGFPINRQLEGIQDDYLRTLFTYFLSSEVYTKPQCVSPEGIISPHSLSWHGRKSGSDTSFSAMTERICNAIKEYVGPVEARFMSNAHTGQTIELLHSTPPPLLGRPHKLKKE